MNPDKNLLRRSFSHWAFFAYALVIYLFLYAPILVVILMSFNSARFSAFPLEQFTLSWYAKLFQDVTIWGSLKNSLIVAGATVVLTLPLSILAAFAISRYQFRLKSAFTSILLIPLIVPGMIMGVSLLSFYNFFGITTNLFTVVLGHTALALPYASLVISARMQGFDWHLEEAASSLGAPYHHVFGKVTLPLLAPGIIAAALFAWTISFDEFVITFFIGSGVQQTLPLKIWSLLKFGLTPSINAVSSIILCLSLLLMTLALAINRSR